MVTTPKSMQSAADAKASTYALGSLGLGLVVLVLKLVAAFITGSVGLLSDALESLVNVAGALAALFALRIAARPADKTHPHGHGKVEYFSSGFEGALIFGAALAILVQAVPRVLDPRPLSQTGTGLILAAVASVLNLGMARILFRGAKHHGSIALEADARHLMTDVWTSVGVVGAIGLVAITGVVVLDPLIAIAVALNIVWTGVGLLRRSMQGLMDSAVAPDQLAAINGTLRDFSARDGTRFHALRTRQSGSRSFVEVHVLVPGEWPVKKGHDYCETVEHALRNALGPRTTIMTHLEPIEDPLSFADQELDRSND